MIKTIGNVEGEGFIISPNKNINDIVYKLINEKAINDVSATNSGVLVGSSQVLIDKFLDVTGQNNTVDTGNTTARYPGYSLSTAWNISSVTFAQSFSVSAKETYPYGVTFKSDGSEMYVIGINSDSVHQYYMSFQGYSCQFNGTYINSILQSSATTIPTGMTKVFVTPLMYEALETGDSVTADVSIDGGSTYTENIPVNTWTTITSTTGTSLIVKANLLTGDGSTSPKVKGWRVLLE